MEVQHLCFNEFPEQCGGCPEYRESLVDQTAQLALLAGMGMIYLPDYKRVIIKECTRYHKRKVEYL
jgi:hypothetical protein